jgi:cyanophycinase
MKKIFSLAVTALMILGIGSTSFAQTVPENVNRKDLKGSLFIVGGGYDNTTEDAQKKYIDLAGGAKTAKIGVIGAASSKPYRNSMKVIDNLVNYGIPRENIKLLPLAIKDDSKTENVDESKWADNANDIKLAAEIKELSGIWFVGGDQTLITKVLLNENKTPTKALEAIWEVYSKGGVIGGTSAGAAIMSDIMIAGGTSAGALLEGSTDVYESMGDQERGPLYLEKGLNFFDKGIVDQHFDRKARLGRLLYLTNINKDKYPYGFGVDENTAMVFYPSNNTLEVYGKGGVTIVDATKSTLKSGKYENFRISYIEKGDMVDLNTMKINISDNKDSTKGYEYMYIENPMVTGPLDGYGTIKDMLAYLLTDNEASSSVKSYVYNEAGEGFELIFSRDEITEGYYSTPEGGQDHYSTVNVRLDLSPIKISILPRN